MHRNSIIFPALMLVSGIMLSGCGSASASGSVSEYTAEESLPAESDEVLVGHWLPQALYRDETIYRFDQIPELADLYDTNWITVKADGTFSYQNGPFTQSGDWQVMELEGYEHSYMFTNIKISRLTGSGDDIKASETESSREYLACMFEGDDNMLAVAEKPSTDSSLLLYVREGETSAILSGSGQTASAGQTENQNGKVKVTCSMCNGTGNVKYYYGEGDDDYEFGPCSSCDGKGYNMIVPKGDSGGGTKVVCDGCSRYVDELITDIDAAGVSRTWCRDCWNEYNDIMGR